MKTEKILEIARRQQPRARLTDEEIEEIYREFPSRIDLFARAMYEKGQAVEREKYADLIAGAKAVGLQPCVVGTRTVWQKKRGK